MMLSVLNVKWPPVSEVVILLCNGYRLCDSWSFVSLSLRFNTVVCSLLPLSSGYRVDLAVNCSPLLPLHRQ